MKFIPLTPVLTPLPACYGKRCDLDGNGPCNGCTVYCGCAQSSIIYTWLIARGLIKEE